MGLPLIGLMAKFKSVGFANVVGKTKGFKAQFGRMSKSVGHQTKDLTKHFKGLGLIASGVLFKLTQASPRLAAEFEILSIRVNELVRPFGDALAPILRIVSDLIAELKDWFESLPEPIQEAITVGLAFATVIGIIAGAAMVLALAFNPLTIVFLGLIAVGAALNLAWQENFLNIQGIVAVAVGAIQAAIGGLLTLFGNWIESIGGYVDNLFGFFDGIVTFLKAVFKADIAGALAAIQTIFEKAFMGIVDFILWPIQALSDVVEVFTGTDFLQEMVKAGQAFVAAFIEGAQKAIDAAGGIVTDMLHWLGEFFGGSLPERGPLMGIDKMGEELGEAYVVGIGSGVASGGNNMSRSLSIENLSLDFREEQLSSERSFFGGINEGVRKSTSW